MATTQEVLDAATKLGNLIADHDAAKKFADTVGKIQADTEAQRLLNDFNRQANAIAEKEANHQPIEPEDKQKLEKLQQDVFTNPLLRDFQVAQMDYMDLMRKVDQQISGQDQQQAAPADQAAQDPNAGAGPIITG